MSEWLPIESAPKDGTLIMCYCPPSDGFENGRHMVWRGDMIYRQRTEGTPSHLRFPATHWMPLPPPPAGEK